MLASASDRLMTLAPRSTASMMAVAVTPPVSVSASVILMESTLACGATPLKGVPACGAAAMMLATAVPCPTQSAPSGTPGTAVVRSGPAVTRSPNCGLASTPLSMTATVTPAPWVRFHTLEKLSARWAHGVAAGGPAPGWPGQSAVGPGSCPAAVACAAAAACAAEVPKTARPVPSSTAISLVAQRTSTTSVTVTITGAVAVAVAVFPHQ